MKKFLLSVVAMMIAAVSFGQVTWGVEAGPNFSSYTIHVKGFSKETSKIHTGLRAGITADIPLANDLYIGTGLFYIGKGGVDKDNSNHTITPSYLQLPVNFVYKAEVGTGKVILGAGPYIAYGIGGKNKYTAGGITYEGKVFSDDSLDKFQHFDAGLGVVAGYQFPINLYIGLNADLGLVNVFDNTDYGKFHNTSFAVSLGYKFGGKK